MNGYWSRRPAYIYDRVMPEELEALNQRSAECYAYADTHGFIDVAEFLAWGAEAHQTHPRALLEALRMCRCERGALLVHSPSRISNDPRVLRWTIRRLGILPLITVNHGRLIIDASGQLKHVNK